MTTTSYRRHIVHNWDDERALTILRNVHSVMGEGAKLLVVERVITPGDGPMFGKLMDLTMLVIHGGQERTEDEFRRLFVAAGFPAVPDRPDDLRRQRDRREARRDSVTVDRWTTLTLVGKWAVAALFIAGGVGHFVKTDVYMKVIPPYLPYHGALVLVSGVFEVALGLLLLIQTTSRLAAWGLITLLVAVFPANVYMYQHPEEFGLSPTLLLIRLPLQGVLILWAYTYTRR